MKRRQQSAGANLGFTMLEVLISLLIISIGMLGLASLQTLSLKNGQSAYYRSVATQLAYDMSDRMRGNITGTLGNGYNRTGINTDYATAVAACGTVAGCPAASLAQNDAYEWQQLVAAALPGGEGIVCVDSAPNDGTNGIDHGCDGSGPGTGVGTTNERPLHAVKIWWQDDRSSANTTNAKKLFAYSFRL